MVYRYQDIYDPANYGATRRPFNHVYGTDGQYITKGDGGSDYPHQRGIFMGWIVNGHGYWTDAGGTVQIHKSYDTSVQIMGPVFSRVSSTISWQNNHVEELIETRTVEAWWIKPGVTLLDFHFTLTEPNGKSFCPRGRKRPCGHAVPCERGSGRGRERGRLPSMCAPVLAGWADQVGHGL